MRKVIGIIIICCATIGMWAQSPHHAPARPGIFAITQPNGDTLHIQLIGDEWWHARLTADGYYIAQGKDGWWYYAQWGTEYTDPNGNPRNALIATTKKAHDKAKRCVCETKWLDKKGIKH